MAHFGARACLDSGKLKSAASLQATELATALGAPQPPTTGLRPSSCPWVCMMSIQMHGRAGGLVGWSTKISLLVQHRLES